MSEPFQLGDELGPVKVIHVQVPEADVKGILVVDNVAAGPAIGGLRIAPDVTLEECFRLARAMTFKNASAGLNHGGGKSVMIGDPHASKDQKEKMVRAFAKALRGETDYIFGPDMGTDELCMGWVKDEINRAAGLPKALGGIPLDELGATGFGLAVAAEVAVEYCDFELNGARVAIQGFGSVGIHAARFLSEKGAAIVAVSDSRGTLHNPDGIDISALTAHKLEGGAVAEFSGGKKMDGSAVNFVETDIWIPAARPDVLSQDRTGDFKAKLILQGANIPMTHDTEKDLESRGVINVPDFIANAGGVICAAMEYQGQTAQGAFKAIEEKIRENTKEVLERSKRNSISAREAAENLAVDRVKAAMQTRRFGIF